MSAEEVTEEQVEGEVEGEGQEAELANIEEGEAEELEGEESALDGEEEGAEDPNAEGPQDAQMGDGLVAGETANQGIMKDLLGQDAAGTDINVNSFEELKVASSVCRAAQDCWRLFISGSSSREAAGEAIYSALFEGAPSLQSLFVTPRAVQAMRFMNGLNSFVMALDDPPKLKILVESLGFGHLHLEVTVPRVVIFRDAILDLLGVELAERFTKEGRDGWKKLLNYVGGAIIFVKAHYAERITILLKSWKEVNHTGDDEEHHENAEGEGGEGEDGGLKMQGVKQNQGAQKKSSGWSFFNSSKEQNNTGGEGETAVANGSDKRDQAILNAQHVPTTFPEMFMFNAAVMGFGQSVWMQEVLACFHNIVTNVANSARLQQECDVLALRISKCTRGKVNLGEYKAGMLAALRSLLPKQWDTNHDVAWTWLWDNVERMVQKTLGQPPLWEAALGKLLGSLDDNQKFEIRKEIYARFFAAAPAGQDFFKQSNTYLHIIADRIMIMTVDFYKDPVKMVDDISALGLRHVGYGIPTELFGAFVTACVEVIMTATKDEVAIEAFRWSLGLISKMLTRTITEGSTIVMKAINANSLKLLKKAVSCAPRGERFAWMLKVQVGTQSISPLLWSIESGNLEAAGAMISDLLTIRADRDRYYYGMDDLFARHPDIVKVLCESAPALMPTLLDGLVWRSRQTEAGLRRVNFYVKHLLLDQDGKFNKALEWVGKNQDPRLVCHEVLVQCSDITWSRVASRTFLNGKAWFLLTLALFVASQAIVGHLNDGNKTETQRIVIMACRAFIYVFSMTQLMYLHLSRIWKAYRRKDTLKVFGVISVPRYLRQSWQDQIGVMLTLCLMIMLALEPILHCWSNNKIDGEEMMFTEECDGIKDTRFIYSVFSMLAMFSYYLLLTDLAVFSTRVSAYNLVCIRMISEVGLFLMSLCGVLLCFSSSISALQHDIKDFKGIPSGALALWELLLSVYDMNEFDQFHTEPAIMLGVFAFMVVAIIFLLNLLVAQLTTAYDSVYVDMVGYARLGRIGIIVETMGNVPKKRWEGFVRSMNFDAKIEFNEGDVGVNGGFESKELASLNPTTKDQIRRFGGSTSTSMQWPEEDDAGDGDEADRFDRLEQLIQKTLKRITKGGGGTKSKGGGGSKTMSGTGSQQESGGQGSGGSGGGDDED